MKVLIIGGTGFIGRHLIPVLQKHFEICVLHRGRTGTDQNRETIIADRREIPSLKQTFKNLNPEIVIDLIPYFAKDARELIETFRGISKHIIALSSGDVYRNYEIYKDGLDPVITGAVHEDDQLRQTLFPYRGTDPDNYLLAHYDKILVEQTLREQTEIDTTILRLGAVYGAFDSQRKLSPYLEPMIKGEPWLRISPEKAAWKWTRVFVREVVRAIVLCLEKPSLARNQIFNVGERESLTQVELIHELKRLTQWPGKVIVANRAEGQYNYKQHLLINSNKIRDRLSYAEQFSLKDGLLETIEFEQTFTNT